MPAQLVYGRPGKATTWRLALEDALGLVDLTGKTPIIRFTPGAHAEVTVNGTPDPDQDGSRGEVAWTFVVAGDVPVGDWEGRVDVDDFQWPLGPQNPLRVIIVNP